MVSLVMAMPSGLAQTASDGWEDVGPGVQYREYRLPGPVRAYVARMDRSNPNVIIDSAIANGMLSDGKETVSGMAARQDDAINAWGQQWGMRNDVIVAINGSFHDLESGLPENGMIQGGWYIKRFEDLWGGSGFDWKFDRRAFVGACVAHRDDRQVISFPSTGNQVRLNGINTSVGRDQAVMFTPQYGPTTGTGNADVEILVEMSQPVSIVPLPRMVTGTVLEIRQGHGSTPIPFDSIVLSANGDAAAQLVENARVGGQIGISQEITHFDEDCQTPHPGDWTLSYASIEASWDFLREDAIYHFQDAGATSRQPRTAICFNDDSIYFVVVDGRQSGFSVGMTIMQLADFCRDTLGATWGVNQDGGGSSTMVVNGEVMNMPSDGHERPVANAMMMISLAPKATSSRFAAGDMTVTLDDAKIRLGPGSNYYMLSRIPQGEVVAIVDDPARVNGVLAKGTHWWKVSYRDVVGWIQDDVLADPTLRSSTYESLMERLEMFSLQ
jgi:hypothetical protein